MLIARINMDKQKIKPDEEDIAENVLIGGYEHTEHEIL